MEERRRCRAAPTASGAGRQRSFDAAQSRSRPDRTDAANDAGVEAEEAEMKNRKWRDLLVRYINGTKEMEYPSLSAVHFHQTIDGIAHDCGNMKSRRVAPGRNEQSCYTMDAMLIDLEDSDVKDGLSGVFPS